VEGSCEQDNEPSGSIKYWETEIGWGGMDWIDLAQDSDQWRALVNRIMNHRAP
jgi:hypothetical protein